MAQTQIPIAAGKAAALSTWLAQGGQPVKKTRRGYKGAGERYATGPMKGMTVDQATQKFESMWAGASDGIKDKYASRDTAGAALSPSEKKRMGKDFDPNASMSQYSQSSNASLNAARPGESPAQVAARQKASRDGTTASPPVVAPPGTFIEDRRPGKPIKKTGFDELTATDPKTGEWQPIQTDLNGDGKLDNADAEANANLPKDGDNRSVNPASTPGAGNGVPLKKPEVPILADGYQGKLIGKDVSTPFGRGLDAAADKVGSGVLGLINAVKKPFTTDVDAAKSDKVLQDFQAAEKARVAEEAKARQAEVDKITGKAAPAITATNPAAVATNQPSGGFLKDSIERVVAGENKSLAPIAPQVSDLKPATRINRLTGLPFGARPGETGGLDATQKATADRMAADRKSQGTVTTRPTDIAAANGALRLQGMVARPEPRAIPAIAPTRQIGNTGSRSLQETSRMADAAKTARESGKMGDYFTSQGKAEMAKAFPNKTEDPKGLTLGKRKPLTTLAAAPLRAIPVNSRA